MLRSIVAAAIVAAVPVAAFAQTGFEGNTLQYQGFFPDLSTEYSPAQTAIVGPGVEFVDDTSFLRVDVADLGFTVFDDYGGDFVPADFNGFVLSDINGTIAAITGVTFTGGGFAGEQPVVTFDADNIYVDFSGIGIITTPGVGYSFDVSFNAVPEPATWAMMLVGVGGIGGSLRAGRKARVAVRAVA